MHLQYFLEGGSALPIELVPCLFQVSALNTLLGEARPDHLTPAAPLPRLYVPSSIALLTLTHHTCPLLKLELQQRDYEGLGLVILTLVPDTELAA